MLQSQVDSVVVEMKSPNFINKCVYRNRLFCLKQNTIRSHRSSFIYVAVRLWILNVNNWLIPRDDKQKFHDFAGLAGNRRHRRRTFSEFMNNKIHSLSLSLSLCSGMPLWPYFDDRKKNHHFIGFVELLSWCVQVCFGCLRIVSFYPARMRKCWKCHL